MAPIQWTETRAGEDSAEGGRADQVSRAASGVEQASEELERSVGKYNDAVEELGRVLGGWARESWEKLEVPGGDASGEEVEGLAGDMPELGAMREEIRRAADAVDEAGECVRSDAQILADAVAERDEVVENAVEAVRSQVVQIGRYIDSVAAAPDAAGLERLGNLERALDAVLRLV